MMNDKQKQIIKGFAGGVLFSGALLAGFFCYQKIHPNKETQIRNYIEANYLYDVDDRTLDEGIYEGILESLDDPYSSYYSSEENEEMKKQISGIYKGIGVILQQDKDTQAMTVIHCYEGAPGEQAGMKDGDVITKVNGESVADWELSQVVERIKASDTAKLTLLRDGKELEVTVTLDEVNIPVVDHELKENKIGYIHIYEFTENSVDQFATAYEALQEQGMTGLIVDLRDNPGGFLTSVCSILREILPEGMITYIEDRDGNREEYTCDGATPIDIPLIVLVNGNSASASEIFCGAVKDHGVGTLVGETSYGKGVVQNTIDLGDGTAMKLTIATYYTPNGTDINGTGIKPDVEVTQEENSKEDLQLKKAIELLEEA